MRFLPIIAIMMLLFSPFAMGQSEELASGSDYNGAPSWPYIYEKLSLLDKVKSSKANLAVVNGAQCASSASFSNSKVINTATFCWENKNGGSPSGTGVVHQGVVFQVFLADGSRFQKVNGDVSIQANTKGCVSIPEQGKNYYYQAFYCDDVSKTCTEYHSVCNTATGVVRERTCLSPSGVSSVERVTDPNWKDSKVGTCTSSTPTGTTLPSNQQTAQPGSTGTGGGVTSTELKGSYSDPIVPDNAIAGQPFYTTATFKADVAGRYYLESTIFDAKLAAVSAEGSKCDGSKQSAGEFVDLKAGEEVQMTFNMIAPSSLGTKTIVMGAYTGCFSQGGKEVTSVADDINIMELSADGTSISSFTDYYYMGGGTVVGAIIGFVLGGPLGAIWGAVIGLLGGYGITFL